MAEDDSAPNCAGCSGLCGWKTVQHAPPADNALTAPLKRRLLPLATVMFAVPLLSLVMMAALVQGLAPGVQLVLLGIVVGAVCRVIMAAGERLSGWALQSGRHRTNHSRSMHQA